MKCSKQFATSHGQSHYPSNMVQVHPSTINTTTPEGTPIITLELQRHTGEKPTYIRIRMGVLEASSLIEALKTATENAQFVTPSPIEATKAALRKG